MADAAKFWDRFSARYARSPVADQASWHRKLDAIAGRLDAGSNLLEFGAGTGSSALKLAPRVGHILSTDISAKMIEIARGKAEAQGVENITFRQAQIYDISKADGPFDAVIGLNVLHLMRDWREAITHARSLLDEGGILALSTAGLADMRAPIKIGLGLGSRVGLLPPTGMFSIGDLRAALGANSFRIVEEWQPKPGAAWFQLAEAV
ncbi:class I SAM-dependent methyltransferase [Pseudoroseicyclus sp. H15]